MSSLPRLQTYKRTDYAPIASRARALLPRTQPNNRGWGPHCDTSKHGTFTVKRPDGATFKRPFRRELAPLVELLVQGAIDLGLEIRKNDEPDGGFSTYNCRSIRGSTQWSWHSWPVAFDLNSKGNPMQSTSTAWRSTMPPWFVTVMESAGFYWGGRYTNADAMHFEYLGRPTDVATDTVNAYRAIAALKPPPEDTVTPEQVKALQSLLNAPPFSAKLVVDGIYGPMTDAALQGAGPRVSALLTKVNVAENRASVLYTAGTMLAADNEDSVKRYRERVGA
jgi:hypothetical protein